MLRNDAEDGMRSVFLLFLTLLMLNGTVARAGDHLLRGELAATDFCASCHQVGPRHQRPSPVYNDRRDVDIHAPPFFLIAIKFGDKRDAIRRHILSPPHPMPKQRLSPSELANIIDYIQSLRKSGSRRHQAAPH